MISFKKSNIVQIKDRKLGDEWLDWGGSLAEYEKNANAGKRTFLGVLLFLILLTGASAYFIWYMIAPRLEQFHQTLPLIAGILFFIGWWILSLWFLLMVLSILFEKDIFMKFAGRTISITFLVPIVLRIGIRFLGISRDRMSNSFVKISNLLIRSHVLNIKPEELLILLPRCLQKKIIQLITAFATEHHIPIFTVAGGEKAREVVYKIRPKAIIGVACERDLLSGIQEIVHKIPVIGIPNLRPEGPCKNTTIDILELEKAIQTFLGCEFSLPLQSS